MKIDRSKLKKCSSEVPQDCKVLIERLKACRRDELVNELSQIQTWSFGKCELYHWIDVLDIFDSIFENACEKKGWTSWCFVCDSADQGSLRELLLQVLKFTALLIEHSSSRNFYNSMEHLISLLASSDMQIVLGVLNLLYVFSKRSNFITRLNSEKRQVLLWRLHYLAESWGGKENGFGLAECCKDLPISAFPSSASTLHFEYYADNDDKSQRRALSSLCCIHIDYVDQIDKSPSEIMEDVIEKYSVREDKQMQLFTHLRLAHSFSNYGKRLLCVQARLQALSILVYCTAVPDGVHSLVYNGLIEELVEVLELENSALIEIKAAALRTLTAIIHLERNPRLNAIIDATGAASYHGFLPVLVRNCIQSLIEPGVETFPLPFATAVFSFLYHLASYENGGDALVSCGMMEALLRIINWNRMEPEYISFVTRAVRVIDLITNLDMQAFQLHGGLTSFIRRIKVEVDICNQEIMESEGRFDFSVNRPGCPFGYPHSPMDVDIPIVQQICAEYRERKVRAMSLGISNTSTQPRRVASGPSTFHYASYEDMHCFPQRAALLKGLLNFVKKSIQDPAFADNIRHLMDSSLPSSLKDIILFAPYYGAPLFFVATDVVTVYVFQEPTLLPTLQELSLTNDILHALLVKPIPAAREVLASLPNIFSALCLNSAGLEKFVKYKPFEKLFEVLITREYLPAMRRRRSSEPMGDTASNLGTAMDELMRHQPSLRSDATIAIVQLLERLCAMGSDPLLVCSKTTTKPENVSASVSRSTNVANDAGSSDDDDDDDEEAGVSTMTKTSVDREQETIDFNKTPVPLVDYILNVMRFVDAILSNNSTDDHCREFVRQKGLVPLMAILGLPNLPIDFPSSPTCQAVASVCKSILNLAHEPQVLKQGLLHLNEVLEKLEPLHRPVDPPGGSVLLQELINAPNLSDATSNAQSTPLLHHMAAAHAYIIMFTHVCRTGQSDIRTMSVSHWGSELGLSILKGLSKLYTSLVWESTVLLALCNTDSGLADSKFGQHQLEKLIPKECTKTGKMEDQNNEFTLAMEALSTDSHEADVDVDEECVLPNTAELGSAEKPKPKNLQIQMKQIKPLLSGASRLGRALAELFGLLVKLCVGSPLRQRRGQQMHSTPTMPPTEACSVAGALTRLLANGLSWEPPPTSPLPKFRLTFHICSVGFTSPMLFDDRKYPYHLMLDMFVQSGAQDAFFETFLWALTCGGRVPPEKGIEHPELSDGTGEFLDAWLMLLEKMVNPKHVLDSPHTIPSRSLDKSPRFGFDPVQYLIRTQKQAFQSIMYLWNKRPLPVYGERMTESMLSILCHILKGEVLIREKLELAVETGPGSSLIFESFSASAARSGGASRRPFEADESVNQEHLVQLVDMGFVRTLAVEALAHTNSLEQATEYLLNCPGAVTGRSCLLDGEDKSEVPKSHAPQQNEEPLSSDIISEFTSNMLEGCFKLLHLLPETVYRICDLLVAVCSRNGGNWRTKMLERLLVKMEKSLDDLSKKLSIELQETSRGNGSTVEAPLVPHCSELTACIHLFTLLFDEMKLPCAALLERLGIISELVCIVTVTTKCLKAIPTESTPKWLPFILLLLDTYEKAACISKRKAPLLGASKRIWKWFDDRTGKWSCYTPSNNKTIDDAYCSGEQTVRFPAGRKRYTVHLTNMVQINEETGNWRPIMLIIEPREEFEKRLEKELEKRLEKELEKRLEKEVEKNMKTKSGDPLILHLKPKVIRPLSDVEGFSLLSNAADLIAIPVNSDTLHALLRLCLRLTRYHQHATRFAQFCPPKLLLSLKQSSSFVGCESLLTLLFRHMLEDSFTLASSMEKVIRSAAAGGSSSLFASKELHYVFRVLGPAACRDPELFCCVAKSSLRIALLTMSKREDEESRYTSPHSMQMLKPCNAKSYVTLPTDKHYVDEVTSIVIHDLLQALVAKHEPSEETDKDASVVMDQTSECVATDTLTAVDDDMMSFGLPNVDAFSDSTESIVSNKESKSKDSSKSQPDNNTSQAPILGKSDICRILAELVKSYPQCAKKIAEYTFHPFDSELITEPQNSLSFIMDNLLHQVQTAGDKNTPALAKVLIAAIATCNHCPEAQTILVHGVKTSLQKALLLPESIEKHCRIRSLTHLITTMIETCPPLSPCSQVAARNGQLSMNNIVRLLLRKGLCLDLAKVAHHLDLSSPQMALTVNSALKPLEILSRIINLPSATAKSNRTRIINGTAESRNVNETMEDDVQTVPLNANNRESNSAAASLQPLQSDFEGIMNQLFNRRSRTAHQHHEHCPSSSSDLRIDPSEPEMSLVDVDEQNETQLMEPHQNDFEVHVQEVDHQESSDSESNPESCHSRCEDDVEREDRVVDEDDEEDEEDDDEASHFDVGDDYQDLEDTLFRLQDQDDSLVFQIEEVFPTSSATSSVVFSGSDAVRSYQVPVASDDSNNVAQSASFALPPSPQSVATSHPLLLRQPNIHYTVASRLHRRQRTYRPSNINHGWQVYSPVLPRAAAASVINRESNTPAILQRLLGPTTAHDLLRWSNFNHTTTAQTRGVLLTSGDIRMFNGGSGDDDVFEVQDQNSLLTAENTGPLSCLASTLRRWSEEARVLDGDGIHDCITSCKPVVMKHLEACRDAELAERKEKRRKALEEESKQSGKQKTRTRDPRATSVISCHSSQSDRLEPVAMDVTEPASQFESCISSAANMSDGNEFVSPSQEASRSQSTERLAASIVEQVLGPALNINPMQLPTVRLPLSSSDGTYVTPDVAEAHTVSTSLERADAIPQNVEQIPIRVDSEFSLDIPLYERLNMDGVREDATTSPDEADTTTALIRDILALADVDEFPPIPDEFGDERVNQLDALREELASVDAAIASMSSSSSSRPLDLNSESDSPAAAAGSSTSFSCNLDLNSQNATSLPAAPPQPESLSVSSQEVPDGVDPSFLAALPENIRQEVISDQLRLQRIRQRAQESSSQVAADGVSFTEVNPEFLAALPPNIQEEVLAQQRAEQQRLAAINSSPDTPVDPVSFMQTLPPGLRQQVLADMDDSLLAIMPSDLAAEAHTLRRELEARHRHIQERFYSSHAGTALSRILRSAIPTGRVGTRYTIHTLPHRNQWAFNSLSSRNVGGASGSGTSLSASAGRTRGRQLLDYEGLACLLVLLFVDEPNLQTNRLHRLLRNLCHHAPTRQWIIRSLLSILEKTKDYRSAEEPSTSRHRHKRSAKSYYGPPNVTTRSTDVHRAGQPSWLSISLDAALGCRTNVFQIRRLTTAQRRAYEKQPQSHSAISSNCVVTIHPLASPLVCRHVLDTLISLAKVFHAHFLPELTRQEEKSKDSSSKSEKPKAKPKPLYMRLDIATDSSRSECDFWDILVKLDSVTSSRKGKSIARTISSTFSTVPGSSVDESKSGLFEHSLLAQLIGLLSHPVVKRSSLLTDRLLRLLALISMTLSENKPKQKKPYKPRHHSDTKDSLLFRTPVSINAEDSSAAMSRRLKLAVEVLTSKACSEDGLEDATSLLLRMSRRCCRTRQIVLTLLLEGARDLGKVVSQHIQTLLQELKRLNQLALLSKDVEDKDEIESKVSLKGVIQDRFTNSSIVITAPSKVKGAAGRELRLASMSALTNKNASQIFFLRVLKVIIQLRDVTLQMSRNYDDSLELGPLPEPPPLIAAMDVDNLELSESLVTSPHLSELLMLDHLWRTLSDCLLELSETSDHHAVLVLQPAVEAFFLVHSSGAVKEKNQLDIKKAKKDIPEGQASHLSQDIAPLSPLATISESSSPSGSSRDDSTSSVPVASETMKFLKFAETHRTVLNQILRQSTTPLTDGPFAVLVDHTRVLDFDVKRRYFRQELERMDEGTRREDLAVHVRREHVFEDSYRELHRRTPEDWKNRFYIVFEGEEGQDAGGLLREWYTIISRDIFNPMYALFTTSPGDRVTYMINSSSHCNSNHLSYFKFVGRVIAKAIYDNKLLECYFTRSFYKHILGKLVRYTDMESEDYAFYQGLVFLLENDITEFGSEITFSVEVQEFGVTEIRDLKSSGRNIPVTEETKHEYVRLVCQEKMTGAIRKQLNAFLDGFYEIIPKRLISIFNEQELELLISGLPSIDIDDLKANTEYHKYQQTSLQIQWFWRALRSFEQADRANFLQFVTGTSKVPLQGFVALEGMNGTQKFQIHRDDRSTDRLPSAHTCFNQLDLPAYETYDKLRSMLLKAIHECSEGFGFA